MVYSPVKRLNAAECLAHPYFDELREEKTQKKIMKVVDPKDFFNFSIGNNDII